MSSFYRGIPKMREGDLGAKVASGTELGRGVDQKAIVLMLASWLNFFSSHW